MAYNSKNYHQKARHIIEVYKSAKNPDVPDTRIVRSIFPKHNIYISYRTWMNLKGMSFPKDQETQLTLF